MTPDDPAWRKFPVFREFFVQWRTARGMAEPGTHKKVFSRDWEELLRDAGLLSAVVRNEAIRDVRVLESVGLLKLKTPTQRPEEILRVMLPLDAEPVEVFDHGFDELWLGAVWVEVVVAEIELAVGSSGTLICGKEGAGVAEME